MTEEKKRKRQQLVRRWKFLIALCIVAVIVWILGEILFGLVLNLGMTVSRIWAIAVIVMTCGFSIWKCPRE
jgi:hypothetical protein